MKVNALVCAALLSFAASAHAEYYGSRSYAQPGRGAVVPSPYYHGHLVAPRFWGRDPYAAAANAARYHDEAISHWDTKYRRYIDSLGGRRAAAIKDPTGYHFIDRNLRAGRRSPEGWRPWRPGAHP